ncbi:YfhO family protein [Streptococcus sp. A23]|uniref:YfhO family protein n=1 Tax=Streptococcus sp. A23 TaxID=3373127 RepID=UPI00374D27E5
MKDKIFFFKKINKKSSILLASFLSPLIIVAYIWAIIGFYPFGDKSIMAVDFGQQYISFFALLKNAVLSGDFSSLQYSFTKSIGGEMTGVVAYYLLSPLNLIYIITPLSHFPLAASLTVWLRYGLFGLSFAYLLIKRYKGLEKDIWLVPTLSTAYALSGMMVSYQMNPIFFDNMYMLPLIIIALEELIDGKKPIKYILFLAISIFMQFYIAYMICIFIALYTLYFASTKIITKDKKINLREYIRSVLQVLGYSLISVGISAILLVPLAINLSQSKGSIQNSFSFPLAFQVNPLDLIAKMMIGGFDTMSWAAGPSLPNFYVGGLAFIAAFFFFQLKEVPKNRKIGMAGILLFFLLSIVYEPVSKLWHMGQNPAGFFHRFSWLISFLLILVAYQVLRGLPKLSKKSFIISSLVAVLSIFYVSTQDYTFISNTQPAALTNFVKKYAVLVVLAIFSVYGIVAWKLFRKFFANRKQLLIIVSGAIISTALTSYLLLKGILLHQLLLTLCIWLLVLFVLHMGQLSKFKWLLVVVTIFELSYNMFLSQVTLAYPSASKFADATISVKRVMDTIQDGTDNEFYRIATNFNYSKTTPSLLNYPGLSTFSSSLERSTLNHFAYLGDIGVNAATNYINGTQLTDALYGVSYYVMRKPFTSEDMKANPEKMYFALNTSRQDIQDYFTEKVYEDDRYVVYHNPNAYSIGFSTNDSIQDIELKLSQPVTNQNAILSAMSGTDKKYFEQFGFSSIELDNLEKTTDDSSKYQYKRIDNSKPGIIKFNLIPKSSFTYYFLAPPAIREYREKLTILRNGNGFPTQITNSQKSLWPLTHNSEGKTITLEFRFDTDDVNLDGVGLVRANNNEITKVLQANLSNNIEVTKWSNTNIQGTIQAAEGHEIVQTSIPYNSGWSAFVDGKEVAIKKSLGSMISFPITPGEHEIELRYQPNGMLLGTVISLLSLFSLYYIQIRIKNKSL